MVLKRLQPPRVGLERPVEACRELRSEILVDDLFGRDVFPLTARMIGVRHVSRRLLQIRHQPSPLQHLRQDVRDTLTGNVRTTQLGDGVVSVFVEDPGVEPLSPLDADSRTVRLPCGHVSEKLVEKQTADGLGRPRVACEECTLDDLRQIGEHKDRAVDVAEVRGKRRSLLRSERF